MSRVSRWDRPPAPKDFRWFLRLVGKVLICTGMLMFGFVAYQLWGTGIQYARAQDKAENHWEEQMASLSTISASTSSTSSTSSTTTLPTTTSTTGSTATTTPASALESTSSTSTSTSTPTTTVPTTAAIPSYNDVIAAMNITEGNTIARLEIPSIGLDTFVFPGVQSPDLEKGPGHFPQTPMPGQLGNSAMAGHRTTWGHPFLDIDQVQPGDEIIVTLPYGRFVYVMTSFEIVAPSDIDVIATVDPTVARLTLTSCHPAYSASQRYILYADLDLTQSDAPGQPIYNYGRDQPLPTDAGLPGETAPAETPSPTTAVPTTPVPTTPVPTELATSIATGDSALGVTTPDPTTTAPPTTTEPPDALYTVVPGGGTAGDEGGGSAPGGDEAFSDRWFSDTDAFLPVAEWAAACVAVVVGAYLLAKRLRNSWIGLGAAVLPFVVGLYFFYENVNRLLPAAL